MAETSTTSSLPKNFRFPRTARIRTRREIVAIQKRGRKIHTKSFVIAYSTLKSGMTDDVNRSRLAVTVSKKVDKRAVVRNGVKRRIRELFRTHQHYFSQPVDLLVIARQSAKECDYSEMKRQIIGALTYNKLLSFSHDE